MTIDHTYFTTVNTNEKAYILGLVLFNIKEKNNDKIVVELELDTEHLTGCNISISYSMYTNLCNIDKNNYIYYKNIDKIIACFNKIGKVKCDKKYNIIELTITSMYIINDIFHKHLDLYLENSNYDYSLFLNTIYNTNNVLTSSFIKAYIEKYGKIQNSCLYINFNNFNTIKQVIEIYKIPNKILKEGIESSSTDNEELYILEYKNSNMIDFLGKIYLDDIHINNKLYNFANNNDNPVLKIIKVDEKAIILNKNNYSDAGFDLTIIKESKRLNSDTILYDTGIKLEIPNGYYVEIVPRSSISKSGYMLANNIGIIDQGYTGNLFVALRKINKDCDDLELPYKCCQIIMKKQVYPRVLVYDNSKDSNDSNDSNDKEQSIDIQETSRNEGGFGSTGK
jgi:deoxyuridine 5'-triphosphate nucleotidohydrolase